MLLSVQNIMGAYKQIPILIVHYLLLVGLPYLITSIMNWAVLFLIFNFFNLFCLLNVLLFPLHFYCYVLSICKVNTLQPLQSFLCQLICSALHQSMVYSEKTYNFLQLI